MFQWKAVVLETPSGCPALCLLRVLWPNWRVKSYLETTCGHPSVQLGTEVWREHLNKWECLSFPTTSLPRVTPTALLLALCPRRLAGGITRSPSWLASTALATFSLAGSQEGKEEREARVLLSLLSVGAFSL